MTFPSAPLVSTDWLAAHLDDPKLRILDASYRMPAMRPPTAAEQFAERHLPGAAFFDIDAVADPTSSLPHMVPSPQEFAQQVGALGVGDGCAVVVYDAGNYLGAPRAWWMFKLYGLAEVRVLEGGLAKWQAEGRAVASGPAAIQPARLTPHFEPERLRRIEQLIANLDSGHEQVVDARSRERFEGAVAEPWPGRRSGRIPGSFNVPFNELIAADGTLKSPEELRAIFAAAKVDLDRPIVTSCGSGVTAAVITLALARLGVDRTALYDGSWAEWGLPDGPALATGPA